MDIKEYLLDTNNFQMPKVLKDREAIATLLVRIIMLEPGTFQSHPNMGVGLRSKFRYSQDTDLDNLKTVISTQISTYLSDLSASNIEVTLDDSNQLNIQIYVDGSVYSFKTDTKDGSITLESL